MKRILIAALVLVLLLGAIGRAQGEMTMESVLEEANLVAQRLSAGEYGAICERFGEPISAQVNETMLDQAWTAQLSALGAYRGVDEAQAFRSGENWVARLTLAHEKGRQLLILTFFPDGKIGGMALQNAPDQAEGAAPADLPEGAAEQPLTLFPGSEKELGGTLLLPARTAPGAPVALLVQGSGSSDRDETVGANKPFRDIAYALAEKGVASLRFDKLSYAHPELFAGDFTVELEYLEPVREALRVLRAALPEGRVYLIGHSQGGMLTPWLIHCCPEIRGGVILAGTPRPMWQVQREQNLAVIAQMPEENRAQTLEAVEAETQKARGLCALTREEASAVTVFGIPGLYAWHMASLDQIALALENAKPLLILQGGADVQVTRTDFDAWKAGLGEAGLAEYRWYPSLNHLFMPSPENLSFQEALALYNTPSRADAGALGDIADWILRKAAQDDTIAP